jgi:sugar fermentation stimulation protein A
VNPSIANAIVRRIIEKGLGPEKNFVELLQEVTIEDSRIDIRLTAADGRHTWIEVKNVPLAHWENKTEGCDDYRAAAVGDNRRPKIALFPDGYRKKKTDTVSPRAAKHLGTLASRVAAGDRAYIIYLCQRTDAAHFEPAALDTIYSESLRAAVAAGVVAKCYRVSWSADFSVAEFGGEIPVVIGPIGTSSS